MTMLTMHIHNFIDVNGLAFIDVNGSAVQINANLIAFWKLAHEFAAALFLMFHIKMLHLFTLNQSILYILKKVTKTSQWKEKQL